jgi:amino acid adenylation domain-containing protein
MLRHILVNNFLEHSAGLYPDKEALVDGNRRLTYGEIDSMANKLAGALLTEGVERGDRVAIFMDNSIEAVVSIFAVLKSGAVFVVINHSTKTKKLEYILNNCRAKVLLTESSKNIIVKDIGCPYLRTVIIAGKQGTALSALSFEEIIENGDGAKIISGCIDIDLASIIYTSGSTGEQKGVMLSHLNMVTAAHSITTYLENSEKDVIINILPLSFDYGLYQILIGFKVGAKVILEKPSCYPYQLIDTMQREKVTGLPGLPTIFSMLFMLKDISKFDLSSLRYITNTATALPVSHIKKLKKIFPMTKLYSMYGLTECKRVSFLSPDELDKRPLSVGKVMPNEEVYIVDENDNRVGPGEVGELVVRGSNVMLGYWEMPEETARCLKQGPHPGERVLYTGDLFSMDDEGYLYFVRRKDDIIKCRGEKVSPKEIENVLYGLNGIFEAAAIGVPDETLGQAVKAFVVLDKESELKADSILNYCSQNLESFKVPKSVEIRSSLPRTAEGKIYKDGLLTDKLHAYLHKHAMEMPDKTAVIQGERRITYGELNHKIFRLASFFIEKKVKPGEPVGILAENSPEYIISYFGVHKAGGISVDINPQFSPHEVSRILNDCHANVLIVESRYLRLISESLKNTSLIKTIILIDSKNNVLGQTEFRGEGMPSNIEIFKFEEILNSENEGIEFPQVTGRDVASIIYTSGTTGKPKGVMLTHNNFMANSRSIIEYLQLSPDDKIMAILPFYYSYGKSILNTHIVAGGTLVLENSFMYPNVVLDKMVDEDITGFAGVPSTFAILLNRSAVRNYNFPKLKYVTQAGGAMSPKHAGELAEILPETQIYIMYGQTEATARLTYLPPEDIFLKEGSIGKPIPGAEIELIKENGLAATSGEEGEIVAKGENIMIGYWNNTEETNKVLKDGRLYTGDIAKMDDEGYLYIVGRRSDMIKSGAHRISPKEIEEVIIEIDEVHEVAVTGIEDEILGDAVKAVIVLKDGLQTDAKKIKRHCQKKLAAFKIPKDVVFVGELPKTSSGKIKRRLCRELTC